MDYILFVDDTGFDNKQGSMHLEDEIVTMVSCLIPVQDCPVIQDDVRQMLAELNEKHEAEEFHFADIYGRNKNFENIEAKTTLDIIDNFADLINYYDIKIITKTITKTSLAEHEVEYLIMNKLVEDYGLKAKGKDLYAAYGLLLNILLASKHLDDKGQGDKIKAVCCDEGIRKAGTIININVQGEEVPLCFVESKEEECLQVADFTAWAVSRAKQTLRKYQNTEMKEFEIWVMDILSTIQKNYVNLTGVEIDTSNVPIYDEIYDETTKKK